MRYNAERARWEGRVTVGLNESGAPRRKMVTATTKRDVLAAMRKLADDASNGIEAQRLTTTVAGMLARWLADVVPGTVADRRASSTPMWCASMSIRGSVTSECAR